MLNDQPVRKDRVKQVLIVTYYFPPSAASGTFRMLGFVQHLPKFGWRASVVAPPRMPFEPVDVALLNRVPIDTDINNVPFPDGWLGKPIRRLVGKAAWLPAAYTGCIRAIHRNRPAAVLTSGPPHCVHMLGLLLKQVYRLPWIADFRDPWLANLTLSSPRRLVKFAEKLVVRNADLVIANAPRAQLNFAEAYPRHEGKFVTITNGFDSEPHAPPSFERGSNVVRVLHAGEIYAGRDPRPYLDGVHALAAVARQDEPRVQTRFIGRVECNAGSSFGLVEEIQSRGLGGAVTILGQLSYRDSLAEMHQANVLLLLDTPGRTSGVPAKLYEYIGSGRPILALAEPNGDVATVLKQSGILHRIAPPRDINAIKHALADLVAAVQTDQPAVSDSSSLRRFTRESLAQELAGYLDRLARNS